MVRTFTKHFEAKATLGLWTLLWWNGTQSSPMTLELTFGCNFHLLANEYFIHYRPPMCWPSAGPSSMQGKYLEK